MTSTNSPKAGPAASPDSDLLTPEEFRALQEQSREMGRRAREARARLKARKAVKAPAKDARKDSGS